MIRYRPFLNTDPPLLVEIWRKQQPFRGQVSGISRQQLDRDVFSKQYFDRHGLILAIEESQFKSTPLGFVHAAFGPNENRDDLDWKTGIISQLKVIPGENSEQVGRTLLQLGLDYLKLHGSKVVYAGSRFPFAPFYLGMYGGTGIPGVMEADMFFRNCLTDFGFESHDRIAVLDRDLTGFRTVVDREQMTLRRQYQIKAATDPMDSNWWESCTMGLADREIFSVSHKLHLNVCGTVSYWDVQPMSSDWQQNCRGIYDLNVPAELRRIGMATFLVGESLRHLMLQGVQRVEAQARMSDDEALEGFRTMGFERVTYGDLMSKRL